MEALAERVGNSINTEQSEELIENESPSTIIISTDDNISIEVTSYTQEIVIPEFVSTLKQDPENGKVILDI